MTLESVLEMDSTPTEGVGELQKLRTIEEIAAVTLFETRIYKASTVTRTLRQHPELFPDGPLSSYEQWISYCLLPKRTKKMVDYLAALRENASKDVRKNVLLREGSDDLTRLRRYPEIEDFKYLEGNVALKQGTFRSFITRNQSRFPSSMGWTMQQVIDYYFEEFGNYNFTVTKSVLLELVNSFSRSSVEAAHYISGIKNASSLRTPRDISFLVDLRDDEGEPPYRPGVFQNMITKRRDIFPDSPFLNLAQILRYCSEGPLKTGKARLLKSVVNYDNADANRLVARMLRDVPTVDRLVSDERFFSFLSREDKAGIIIYAYLAKAGVKNILSPGYNVNCRTPLMDNIDAIIALLRKEGQLKEERLEKYAEHKVISGVARYNLYKIDTINPSPKDLWFVDLFANIRNGVPNTLSKAFTGSIRQETGRAKERYKIAELIVLSQFPFVYKKRIIKALSTIRPGYLSRGELFAYRLASHYFMPKTKAA